MKLPHKEITPQTKKNLDELAFIYGLAALFIVLFLLSLDVNSIEKLIS